MLWKSQRISDHFSQVQVVMEGARALEGMIANEQTEDLAFIGDGMRGLTTTMIKHVVLAPETYPYPL